jgi:protein O-GlcNAc transferase
MTQVTIDQAIRLALQHHQAGRIAQAERIYRDVLAQQPNHSGALHLLGVVAQQLGQLDTAIELIGRAIAINPVVAEYYIDLSSVLGEKGLFDEAVTAIRQAIRLKPDFAPSHYNLGNTLYRQGKFDEAIESYRCALKIKPDYVNAHINLGVTLCDMGRCDEAIASLRQAVRLKPDLAAAQNNLGTALCDKGELDEAIAAFRRAIELQPDLAEAHNNLASALKDQGNIDDAIACYDRAVALAPHNSGYLSNRIYTLTFHPGYMPSAILQEHLRWNDLFGKPLLPLIKPHGNDCNPNRRLRVGYVSPDFRAHPVGRFVLPLLAAHDHARFEIFCYAWGHPDDFTARIRGCADAWRNIAPLSDDQAAEMIREDRIDVLVDLAMHMAKNRLPLFARKPAPVQATYLAYAGTTGQGAMDYRITDPHLDPPGSSDGCYSEESIYVKNYWCYQPPIENLPITPVPAVGAGFVTFGCLNNFAKVTSGTLQAWCELLATAADSRLVLHAKTGSHRDRIRQFLSKFGIDPQRITFVQKLSLAEYMEQYQQIDIALDPFPYVGGTTTCDALWMGVPVITLRGQTAISRGGVSILTTIGFAELIADNTKQYVQITMELAHDRARLIQMRSTLRQQMQDSPLTDARGFARQMESVYRKMWERWCSNRSE